MERYNLSNKIITEAGKREKHIHIYVYVFNDYTRRITWRLMIGGRLLSIYDAIGRPANDWHSALGCCAPRTPLLYAMHSRDTYSALHWRLQNWSTVRSFAFVRYKTPLEPVFRAVDESLRPSRARATQARALRRVAPASDFYRDENVTKRFFDRSCDCIDRRVWQRVRKIKALIVVLRF